MNGQQELEIREERKVETVEGFKFDPIRGRPMLQWAGKRSFESTQYFPAQEKERYGEEGPDGWMNQLYWGDNLQVMSCLLKKFRGRVNLIYIDPPFNSKADYSTTIQLRGKSKQKIKNQTSFEEKQYTDIWKNDEYLQFMYERLILCRELLAETGSIYVHVDWHVCHYLKVVMDEVFGSNNFKNEIIWHYYSGGAGEGFFAKKHDNILFYGKTSKTNFNPQSEKKYVKGKKPGVEVLKNAERVWEEDEDGVYTQIVKRDVWYVPIINPLAVERTGYETQKPEELVKIVIESSSNPGDLVFDCFMGSGTTQAVAMKLGRKFIGADINLGAIQTTTKRLLGVAEEIEKELPDAELPKWTGFEVYNVNDYDVFRNPVEARNLLVEALELQPLGDGSLWDGEKDEWFYKIMPVNRLATKADLGEIVAGFDWKGASKFAEEHPGEIYQRIKLVCMGHEPDLKASLEEALKIELGQLGVRVGIEVVDILRDESRLVFKREAEGDVAREGDKVVINAFWPMNLLKKLSMQKTEVSDWRELVDSVMIDFNYDGVVFTPTVVDVPERDEVVKGEYAIPAGAGTIRVKITDLLSESIELEVP